MKPLSTRLEVKRVDTGTETGEESPVILRKD